MNMIKRIFKDGLNGMAVGWFCTFVFGTILTQIGNLIGGTTGALFGTAAAVLKVFAGAGIGAGIASKLGESVLISVSAAAAGMIGAYGTEVLNGSLINGEGILLEGPGQPLAAFAASYVGIELGRLLIGRTKLAVCLAPVVTILVGGAVGIFVSPYIEALMGEIAEIVRWGTRQSPLIMGAVMSVTAGIGCSLPIDPIAFGSSLSLSGVAAGAAAIGCSTQMIGFAAASFRENGIGGFLVQGIGTSMLQIPNIIRKPWIWLPTILSSAILGAVSATIFDLTNNSIGAVMGTTGLYAPMCALKTMGADGGTVILLIFFMYIAAPAVLTYLIAEGMRRIGIIKSGDMKLDI